MRPAIIDLRDTASRRDWEPRWFAGVLDALDLVVDDGAETWRSFAPPAVLIVVAAYLDGGAIQRCRPWLAEANRIYIVRDSRDPDEGIVENAENTTWWPSTLHGLPVIEVVDWIDDVAPLRAVVARAVADAAGLVDESPTARRRTHDLEIPPSSWTVITCDRSYAALSRIVRGLHRVDDRALLGDHDLAALPASIAIVDRAIAFVPDQHLVPHPGRQIIGEDPVHPIAWRGDRMTVYWSYRATSGELGFLTAGDHDFPCGPAKKLWGHSNNDPVYVAMSPEEDVFAATFGHDVLVTSNVPIRWTRVGPVDIAIWKRDVRRAVLFAQLDAEDHIETDPLEEDYREAAPTVVVGPDETHRYAVDLTHLVHRITRPADDTAPPIATEVGGPGGGYAVCDADHRIVRRGTGRLCGGWFRYATIDDGGSYWREDLATGERVHLGASTAISCADAADEAIALDAAREGRFTEAARIRAASPRPIAGEILYIPIPGTRNVLALAPDALRVI